MATKFYTFTGESSMEALKKAQAQCGERAILVTTKQIQPKTINKKPLYEILVSVEEDASEQKKNQPQKQSQKTAIKSRLYVSKISPKFKFLERL